MDIKEYFGYKGEHFGYKGEYFGYKGIFSFLNTKLCLVYHSSCKHIQIFWFEPIYDTEYISSIYRIWINWLNLGIYCKILLPMNRVHTSGSWKCYLEFISHNFSKVHFSRESRIAMVYWDRRLIYWRK